MRWYDDEEKRVIRRVFVKVLVACFFLLTIAIIHVFYNSLSYSIISLDGTYVVNNSQENLLLMIAMFMIVLIDTIGIVGFIERGGE